MVSGGKIVSGGTCREGVVLFSGCMFCGVLFVFCFFARFVSGLRLCVVCVCCFLFACFVLFVCFREGYFMYQNVCMFCCFVCSPPQFQFVCSVLPPQQEHNFNVLSPHVIDLHAPFFLSSRSIVSAPHFPKKMICTSRSFPEKILIYSPRSGPHNINLRAPFPPLTTSICTPRSLVTLH